MDNKEQHLSIGGINFSEITSDKNIEQTPLI